MTSVSVPRKMSATPKTIAAAILAVRNLIMPDVPCTFERFCYREGYDASGHDHYCSFVGIRLSELKVGLYKNQGELYFGIIWSRILPSNRCDYVSTLAKNSGHP
jgi:hypothetical protein